MPRPAAAAAAAAAPAPAPGAATAVRLARVVRPSYVYLVGGCHIPALSAFRGQAADSDRAESADPSPRHYLLGNFLLVGA